MNGWITVLGSILVALIAAGPGYLALRTARETQRRQAKAEAEAAAARQRADDARAYQSSQKMVDEAYERAARFWTGLVNQAEAEVSKLRVELEQTTEAYAKERVLLRRRVSHLERIIGEMRTALVAAGVPLPSGVDDEAI